MTRVLICFLCLTVCALHAAGDTAEEIGFLLNYIENSQARFFRNGTEYNARDAADHLRGKLGHAGGKVKTAEDFIAGVASKSSVSGEPYKVKLSDGKEIETGPWLSEVLARHRNKK